MRESATDGDTRTGRESEAVTDGGVDRPDWVDPAARCGLEVALVVLIAAYLWANLDSQLVSGVVAVLGVVVAVAVLFYYVNQQAHAWVKYASAQNRRQQRKRKREKRQRRRRRQQEGQGQGSED